MENLNKNKDLEQQEMSLNSMGLVKPKALKKGDKVAAVSLAWGGAGDKDKLWRYEQGKKNLEKLGLEVVEMKNTLQGSRYIYDNPQKRAEDLMDAFRDETIKGIFTCAGGNDCIRILPYIDYDVIRENPKVFIGYSDITIAHMICLKAGLSSFYGPVLLIEFAENVEILDYTKKWFEKAVFCNKPMGLIEPSQYWTSAPQPWNEKEKTESRERFLGEGYELLQGTGSVTGTLMGGCIEVLDMMKGTEIWPDEKMWEDAIVFLEVSDDILKPVYLEISLRAYANLGVFKKAKAIVFGKPYNNEYYEEYKRSILRVIYREEGLTDLPILYNVNFGHTSPMITIPYGALGKVDCHNKTFSILESGVR